MPSRCAAVLAALCAIAAQGGEVWPEEDWKSASPESQGLSSADLEEAAAYALASGGGSGCVIRHGYLVREWGPPDRLADIKSCTKGSIGTTLLGLAVDAGLVRLEDRAQAHYPEIGNPPAANAGEGRLGEITLRQLATMTAGFDDGRPPALTHRPGTAGHYSNDTSNMLAELLTLRFGEDLRTVLERRIMKPLGVPRSQWEWRENAFRPKTIRGLASREFASGITITHRALARIGYLYLRGGRWKDQTVISREFIAEAITPTALPAPWTYYAFYWGSNARGTYAGMPRDAFWALGLGDSFVAVCPSLDLVAVRLGVGSTKSQLPVTAVRNGGEANDDWGRRVEGFLRLVARAVRPPLPPSPVIRRVEWAPVASILRLARGSDNWPLAWADDGELYGAYGDGSGFEPAAPWKLSLGFARISGSPPDITGENIRSPTGEGKGDGPAGRKASGLLMVEGVLYLWARNAANSQLAWSSDRGKSWTWADWKLTRSFGCPAFLQYGKDYAGERRGWVYVYSTDADDAYTASDRLVLARVPRGRIREREAYEFFEEIRGGEPRWTADIERRGAVLAHPGRCYRSTVSYDAGLGRYLCCQILPGPDPRFEGGFGIFDAPEPWGPWTTAYFAERWDVAPGETASLPPKWMSPDGRTVHLVFSGDDCFSVRKAELKAE